LYKSALLLTVTTFALLATPAFAAPTPTCTTNTADLSDITKKVNGPICTSTAASGKAGDIVIDTDGIVTEPQVTGTAPTIVPAVSIDSNNLVTNKGTINFTGTNNAIGVQLDTGNTGGFDLYSAGVIDMRNAGTGKFGILITDATSGSTGTFTGVLMPDAATPITTSPTAIDLEAGSTLEMTGDGSTGIGLATGNTLVGDIDIAGTITMTPTKTGEASGTATSIGVNLLGDMTGNFNVQSGGDISVEGPSAEGVVLTGVLTGEFDNGGTISTYGTSTPDLNKTTNALAGSAVIIENNVTGGIVNDGPTNTSGTNASGVAVGFASISTSSGSPALLVAATTSNLTIGPTNDTTNTDTITGTGYSLLNRGTISGTAVNPDVSTSALSLAGSATSSALTFTGGLFNSGTISASATTKSVSASGNTVATAITIGNFATVPDLVNSNQSGQGDITASVSGDQPATAQAILIESTGTATGSASLQEIDNLQGSTISAFASTTDNTNSSLQAIAIEDLSGSLTKIVNDGTITAGTTVLTNNEQRAEAIYAGANTAGIDIVNGGAISGDILLGSGADTLQIGDSTNSTKSAAIVSGNVFFGGDLVAQAAGNYDTLDIESYGSFAGQVQQPFGSLINVSVATGGSLTLENNGTTFDDIGGDTVNGVFVPTAGTCPSQPQACGLQANTFTTAPGSNLTIDVAQVFNQSGSVTTPPAVIAANTASLATGTTFSVGFGSFVTSVNKGSSQFVLIGTPTMGALTIGNFVSLQQDVDNELPFLFDNTSALCTVNVAGGSACADPPKNVTGSALVLNLDPRVPVANCNKTQAATNLCLNGFAYTMFGHANAALANDTALGSAVLSAGLPVSGIALTPGEGSQLYQKIYAGFAPDVTGSARAIAISLSDQGSGEVGARQRALRMYAGQDGDTTIWGQEFTQDLNVGNKAEAGGYDDTGFGFVLGADGGNPRNGRYGVAFQFYSGDTHEKSPRTDNTNSEWLMLTGYTDWRGKGFFLDSQGSIGYAQLKGQRFLNVGPAGAGLCSGTITVDCEVSRDARGDRAAEFLSGGVTSGVLLAAGGTVFTPQISLDGLTMREEGYTEQSSTSTFTITRQNDGFDLTVKPNYMNSLRAFAGADIRQDLNLGDFFLQPEVRAGYRYDFIDGAEKVKAAFVSQAADPANYFTITGPDPARGNLVLGGGLAVTTGAWSVGVSYDYVKGVGGTKTLDQVGTFTLVGRM
jgi:hypothetical protein